MEDLPELAAHFLALAARRERKATPALSAETTRLLKLHSWPGNVRELENVLARAVILCDAVEIGPPHLPKALVSKTPVRDVQIGGPTGLLEAVEQLERAMILDALEKTGWVKAKAARTLKLTERILSYKMDAYGISRQG
jgi:DNA-binding NtrC family response regulator